MQTGSDFSGLQALLCSRLVTRTEGRAKTPAISVTMEKNMVLFEVLSSNLELQIFFFPCNVDV